MPSRGRGFLAAVAFVVFLLPCELLHAQDALFAPAREHLLNGRARQALELLDPLERVFAGQREYDELFAQALLDAGNPARALFPINRMLGRNPDDPVALLMLSRAQMALGQAQPAREALDRAGRTPVPADTAKRIDQYLSIIAAAEEAGATRVSGYLEILAGYDTNVNSATGAQQVALPAFGGAIGTLSPAATRQEDGFFAVNGSVGLRYLLSPALAFVGSATALQRLNFSEKDFDLRLLEGSAGLQLTSGASEWTAVLTAQQFEVDYQRFRTTRGGSAQWRHVFGPRTEVSAFVQLARLTYPSQSLRDADRRVVGIALGQALPGERPPIVFASVYAGEEDERAEGVPSAGHRLKGLRFGVDKRFDDRLTAAASIGFEKRRYGGIDTLFLIPRHDEQLDLRFALAYTLAPRWILVPQITYTDSDSNVELSKYRRTAVFVALRYQF